jgi:hypothetical protein
VPAAKAITIMDPMMYNLVRLALENNSRINLVRASLENKFLNIANTFFIFS